MLLAFSIATRQKLVFAFGIALLIGIIISKALISIGMFGILGTAILTADIRNDLPRFWQNKAYLATCGIFFIILMSGIYTQNWQDMSVHLRIALPLLGMPLAFALLPIIPKTLFFSWLYIFVISISIASLGVLINYSLNYDAINIMVTASQAIPTPNNDHIRFSLLVALAIFAAGYLVSERYTWRYKWERNILIALLLFLFITIHILSVRSGLLGLYSGLFVLLIRWIWLRRKFLIGGILLLGLLSAPFIAYQAIPSFRIKYGLMRHNLILFSNGHIGEYSDTQRLLSYYVAWQVAAEQPLLGVGMGDVRDEQDRYYAQHYPDVKSKYPHNQFLLYYMGTGIVGVCLFIIAFFLPLFYHGYARNSFFVSYFVVIFTSFLTENTLSIAIGMAIYTFFLLATINFLEGQRNNI